MLGGLCCVEGEYLSRPPAGFGNIGRSRDIATATNGYICTKNHFQQRLKLEPKFKDKITLV